MHQAAVPRRMRRRGAPLLLCLLLLPIALTVLLTILHYEHTVSAKIHCASTAAAPRHHHPSLQQGPLLDSSPMPPVLTTPQHAAVAASRAALQAYLASPQFAAAAAATMSSSSSWQRGILVVAGGRKLLTHLVVQLRVLRETLRCTVPVEVAWQGPQEMDEPTLAALQDRFGPLRGFDVQAMPYPAHMKRVPLNRWVGKVAALLHCSFREVLLLDSDNIPLRDPSHLFVDPLYRQHGNLFWPDFWSDWVKPGVYPWLGITQTAAQPLLAAGAGFTGRDAESGMLLIDRGRWLAVLQWALWINTWHEQLYYRVIHGDKDTFALAFALAGHADKYRQVSVAPGGVFRWDKDQLEVKATGPNSPAHTADGWQLLGALQYDDTRRPSFFHRTMNKLSPDQEPWPAELVTGPLPTGWLQYYLAHDSLGPTKGVWWQHVAPDSAFDVLPQGNTSSDSSALTTAQGCCDQDLYRLYTAARAAGLPVEQQPDLECACRHAASLSAPIQGPAGNGGAPVPAARVRPALLRLSATLRVIEQSVAALAWLCQSEEGRRAFPSLASPSSMP